MISENDVKRNNEAIQEAMKCFDKPELLLFAKKDSRKTIEEVKQLDIPFLDGSEEMNVLAIGPPVFHPMTKIPNPSKDDPDYSDFVVGYDEDDYSACMTYYNFKKKVWCTMERESIKLICWIAIPSPKEFLKGKSWSHIKNEGYTE